MLTGGYLFDVEVGAYLIDTMLLPILWGDCSIAVHSSVGIFMFDKLQFFITFANYWHQLLLNLGGHSNTTDNYNYIYLLQYFKDSTYNHSYSTQL